jgi:hypothetical protein
MHGVVPVMQATEKAPRSVQLWWNQGRVASLYSRKPVADATNILRIM